MEGKAKKRGRLKPNLYAPMSDRERAALSALFEYRIDWCARLWARALHRDEKAQRRAWRHLDQMYAIIKAQALIEGIPIADVAERTKGKLAMTVLKNEAYYADNTWPGIRSYIERAVE